MAQHVPFVIEPQNKQQIAFHLRLTPQLLEALVRSQEESEPVSIQFGARDSENAITVGETHIGFNKVDENGTCDLLRIGAPGGAAVVARVKQKLMLQRNLKDEKGRFRARAEEAERERKERKMVLLSSKPVQGKGGKMEQRHSVRSVTPPPRGPTPPPRALPKAPPTASMLAVNPPQPRPPLPPAAAAPGAVAAAAAGGGPGGRLTPPPGAAAAPGTAAGAGAAGGSGSAAAAPAPAPKQPASKKAGVAGRLGLGKNSSTGSLASVAGGSASPAVVDAARRLGLRGALLALLLERSLNMQGVKGVLADAESKLKGSKGFKVPDKAALERALKSVAEYRNPGKYFLYDCLRKEAEEAAGVGAGAAGREPSPNSSQEAGGAEAGGGGGSGGKAKADGGKGAAAAAGSQQQQQQQQQRRAKPAAAAAAAAGGGGGGGDKRSREVTPEVGGSAAAGKVPKLTPAQRAVASLLADPPAPAAAAAAAAANLAATPPADSPASRATPASTGAATTTTTGGSGEGSGAKRQRAGSGAAGATAAAAAAAAAGAAAGAPPMSRGHTSSSLSRGSQEFDDSWIQRHLERQPDVVGPISSKQEYHAREAAFNDKYVDYFKLHQLIEANKKDFGALRDALGAARTPGERQRYQSEIDKLYRKRGERAKRWDAAFKVLHAELAAAKQRMAEFVAAFQAQQAQQQGPAPAPAAAPAVPVK